jgi:hypothetical protein
MNASSSEKFRAIEKDAAMDAMAQPERDDNDDPLVGNPAIAEFATSEGYKTSTSSMQKHTSPAINTGPELVGYYGKLPTTTKGRVRAWISSRMRPVRRVAQRNQETISA